MACGLAFGAVILDELLSMALPKHLHIFLKAACNSVYAMQRMVS